MVDPILNRPSTKEQDAYVKGRDKDLYNFWDLLEVGKDAYVNSEYKRVDQLCLWVITIAKEFEGDTIEHIPENYRNQVVGDLFMRALSERPPAVKLKIPSEIKIAAANMVKMAGEQGGYARADGNPERSAFIFIAKRLEHLGIQIQPRTINSYWHKLKTFIK